jgi:2-hydroxycyclohexanecarboxyl-CoA dehydrogenase
MELHLRDHVVVVTGGAAGIGQATAEAFAIEGCRVAIWDRAESAPEIARALGASHGVETFGVVVDVTRETAVKEAVEETERRLGPIDHLVHAAAVGSGKFGFPFTNLTPDDWRRPLEVNVLGMVNVAHAVAPAMIARKQGTFVFLGSVAWQNGSQTDPPYSAAKAAGINFAICLAKDLASHGVRVNTVNPGMVQTALNESVWRAWNDQQPPDLRRSYADWADEKVRSVVPLGRWQEPADIADMIVFLSSDRARQVTGQTINVDGGYVMR